MSEKKKETFIPHSDIHRIVDLPIEAVMEYLNDLPSYSYSVSIKKISSDEAQFRIKTKRKNKFVIVQAEGRLRRWNGTFTRLDADIKVIQSKFKLTTFLKVFTILSVLLSFCIASLTQNYILCLGLAVALLVSPILIVQTDVMETRFNAQKVKFTKVHRALMKDLENALSKELKAKAAILHFDGTEDNLAERLQEVEYQYFRLKTDGEIDTP